jgi:hypothetical protein
MTSRTPAVLTIFLWILSGIGAVVRAADSTPIDVGERGQLFLHDDYLISNREGLRLVMGRLEKHRQNPIMVPDRPWELNDTDYGCLIHDKEEGIYKLWYESRENNGILGDPSRPERGRSMLATSKDGIHWEKPNLGIISIDGSKANNVVFTGPPGKRSKVYWIMKDYADPDAAKRYKMMFHLWDFRGRGVGISYSPDGLHWNASPYLNLAGGFDTQNLFLWDDRIGQYVGYLRTRQDGRRCIGRSTSPDAFHWSSPLSVHCGDEMDPPGFDLYTPGVFKYSQAENVYVMLTAAFEWSSNSLFGQLSLSRDGIHWSRFREPFLPLGKSGEWDSGSIYPIPSEAVIDGKTAIYYRGNATGHGGGGKPGYGVAFLPEGGFAGWRADEEGTLVTRPLVRELGTEDFFLNADASGGSIQAELLDSSGTVLKDFSRQDCKPITTKGSELRITWKGRPERVGPVRLKLYITRATVYGFKCKRGRPVDHNA